MGSQRIKRLRGTIFDYSVFRSRSCHAEGDGRESNLLTAVGAFKKRIAMDPAEQNLDFVFTIGTKPGHCHTAVPSTFGPELFLLRFDFSVTIRIFFLNVVPWHKTIPSLSDQFSLLWFNADKGIRIFQIIPAQKPKLFHPDGQGSFGNTHVLCYDSKCPVFFWGKNTV